MALQIRRGLQANLPASPADGELLYATDTGNLYIGVSGSPQIISFSGGGGGASAISDLTDVASVSGITNGQALLWNTANARFEYGNIPASYGDADVETLLATKSYANTSTLTNEINTANSAMQVYVDALETRIVGGANVNLDSLAEVANALANSNTELSTVAFTGAYSDVTGTPTLALGSNTYLTFGTANIDLSSVVGQTGAQGVQGIQGNTGPQGVSVTNASLSGSNLIITLSDASSVDAGNVRGPIGPQGATGATGPQGNIGLTGPQGPQGNVGPQGDGNAGISSATVTAGDLVLTLNDATTINAGNVVGPQGTAGVGITSTSLVGGNLILNYSNTSTQDVGNIQGPQGDQGIQGPQGNIGLTGATGPQGNVGPQGPAGVDVSSASVNGSGNLIITLSDASTVDAGNVRGADGAVDQTLTLNSTAGQLAISGSGGNNVDLRQTQFLYSALGDLPSASTYHGAIAHVHAEGAMYFAHGGNWVELANASDLETNTDAQTLSIAGNVITISGSNSNVDLTSALAGAGGGGIASIGSNVIADLSDVSSTAPSDGQALIWDNGNSTWAPGTVSSGGGASALNDLSDVSTAGASSGQVLKYNGSSWAPAADSTGSGGGSGGSTIERFELTYNSNGTLNATQNLSAGISSVVINDSSGGDVTITFDSGFNYPPASILIYGYNYTDNKYNIVPFTTDMGLREIAAGGSSGSPSNFNGSTQQILKLRLREAETGASRGGFGTVTHAWIQFVMYD